MNDLGDDLTGRAAFLNCVPGCDDIAIVQMESGAANLDFARLLWNAGILGVFQYAERRSFGTFQRTRTYLFAGGRRGSHEEAGKEGQ
jgi:hypothetical protein